MPSARWVSYVWQKPVAAALAWAVSAAMLFHRLPFGTSYGDEAYYNAMPYSFAIGSKPYVDELGVFQNAGVLQAPFFRAYIAIAGSGDGIVLFNRYLYFVYALVASILAFRLARRISSTSAACCVGALVVSFSYFNIFAISYNTVGAFSFFCGMVTAANALLNPRPGRGLFAASLFCLAGMFGYPGLTPAVLSYLLIVLGWLYRKTARASFFNGLWGLGAGAAVALLTLSTLAMSIGRAGIARLAEFTHNMGYGNQSIWQRLNVFGAIVHTWRWMIFAYIALFIAVPLLCRYLKHTALLVAAGVATAAAFAYCYWSCLGVFTPSAAAVGLTVIPVLAPLCVALNRSWKYGHFVLLLLWAPSTISMVTLTYTSSNQWLATYLGVLGALFAGVVSFAAYIETLSERSPQRQLGYQALLVALVASLLLNQDRGMYAGAYSEESRLDFLDTRVHSGPFRGTKTAANIAFFLESIDRDLKTVERENPEAKTLTVFDDFPAGYMSTRLKPRTFANWIIWGFFPAAYAHAMAKEAFGSPEKLPDILLEVHTTAAGRSYWEKFVRRRFKPIIKHPELDYMILKKIEKRPAALGTDS
jgi:hypothetical protein